MNKRELLSTYRAIVIELEELRHQLNRVGTDGRPRGCHMMQLDSSTRGTNDPNAAAMQLADGLEAMAQRKEAELQELSIPVGKLLQEIRDFRTYMVIQHYYVLAKTDEQVAMAMSVSRARVNQIRREYLGAS